MISLSPPVEGYEPAAEPRVDNVRAKVQGFGIATTQLLLTSYQQGYRVATGPSLGPVDHSIWSHCIFRRCTASLPTSLGCIASVDKRLSIEETGCGYAVRRQESSGAHRPTSCSLELLATTEVYHSSQRRSHITSPMQKGCIALLSRRHRSPW